MSGQALGSTGPPTQWGTSDLSWGLSAQGVKLITHLHLVLRLRVSGALPLLPLYAFMTQTRTTLPFTFTDLLLNATHSVSQHMH